MSREDLTPRAVERLLEVGAPLLDEPELTAVNGDRYELKGVLGRGGMGVVYEAWDTQLERTIALKVLSRGAGLTATAQQRFVREAKAAARLVHPHIASVYDATPEAIAMQRIDGDTLAARNPDDPRELAALVRDAALAIHFAHDQGIIHRDIKPANLMVEPGDRPHIYVMDFGVAKHRAVDASISVTESLVGTPAFMAPEQAAGGEVGPRTDVYGLGATLYACLSGRAPFADDDLYGLLRRVVEQEPPQLRQIAPAVDRDLATIVSKCMAKDPQDRYASALAVAGDLDRWLRREPIEARPPSLAYRARRYLSRRQGVIAASAAAAAIVILIAMPFLIHARARRAAAEGQQELAEGVLALSQRVNDALQDARSTRLAGVGHEGNSHAILEVAIGECRAFLEVTDAGHVWLFVGQLLREQGRYDDALDALDHAGRRVTDSPLLAHERGLVLAALYRSAVPIFGEQPPAQLESWRARGVRDLETALQRPPRIPTAQWLFAEGQLAWLRGDLQAAIGKHREVVEMDGAHQEAHLSLSRLYLLADREDLAVRHSVVATDLLRGHRPAYVARADPRASQVGPVDLERELLPLEGMRELLVDFNLLLQLEPGNAHTYGMRGQVQARQALRAIGRNAHPEALLALQRAIRELSSTLTLQPNYAPALINRGVCRAQLARVLSVSGEPTLATTALNSALADYDAAIAADPKLAIAWYDRALLRQRRSRLAQLAMAPGQARQETDRARADAAESLARAPLDHPWRWRFETLAEELEP